jgi:hypothetical protein
MDGTIKYSKIDLIMVNQSMVGGNKVGGDLVTFKDCAVKLSGNHLIIIEYPIDLEDIISERHTVINLDNIKQYKTYRK